MSELAPIWIILLVSGWIWAAVGTYAAYWWMREAKMYRKTSGEWLRDYEAERRERDALQRRITGATEWLKERQ